MKWIDMPPIWLAVCLALAWLQKTYAGFGLTFGGEWADFAGGLLIGGGLVLILLAAREFRRFKTTIVPHEMPTRLLTTGLYAKSRNPIYLGDMLILTGAILAMDAVLSLPLVPILLWILETRFILPEENRLRRNFRADFARYALKTRRWL